MRLVLVRHGDIALGIGQEADLLAHRRAPSRGGSLCFVLAFGRGIRRRGLLQGTVRRRLLER